MSKPCRTFAYFSEIYLNYKEENCSKNTSDQTYYIIKEHLLGGFGHIQDITLITELEIEEYLRQKKKLLKISDHKKHLRGIFSTARKHKLKIDEFKMAVFDPKKGRGKIYSRQEIATLLKNCSPNHGGVKRGYVNRDMRLMIYHGVNTGERKSEVAACHDKNMTVRKTWFRRDSGPQKRGVERGLWINIVWFYLPPEEQKEESVTDRSFACSIKLSRMLIARRLRLSRDKRYKGWLYPSKDWCTHRTPPHSAWQRLKIRSKIRGSYHALRNTKCSNTLAANIHQVFVEKLLGMCAETVRRYAEVPEHIAIEAAESLRKAA